MSKKLITGIHGEIIRIVNALEGIEDFHDDVVIQEVLDESTLDLIPRSFDGLDLTDIKVVTRLTNALSTISLEALLTGLKELDGKHLERVVEEHRSMRSSFVASLERRDNQRKANEEHVQLNENNVLKAGKLWDSLLNTRFPDHRTIFSRITPRHTTKEQRTLLTSNLKIIHDLMTVSEEVKTAVHDIEYLLNTRGGLLSVLQNTHPSYQGKFTVVDKGTYYEVRTKSDVYLTGGAINVVCLDFNLSPTGPLITYSGVVPLVPELGKELTMVSKRGVAHLIIDMTGCIEVLLKADEAVMKIVNV